MRQIGLLRLDESATFHAVTLSIQVTNDMG
jgi:hypothetical protein